MKAFWDVVEQRLAGCSAEELRAIVRALARATPATARQAFLNTMQLMAETTPIVPPVPAPEALLVDIAALADELQAATEEAEGWDEYHEEDSLGPYAEFVAPLTALFDRAAAVFDAGNMTLARTAYHNLFATLTYEDDYGRGYGPSTCKTSLSAQPAPVTCEPCTRLSRRRSVPLGCLQPCSR